MAQEKQRKIQAIKKAACATFFKFDGSTELALTRLKAWVLLVDNVNAATTTNDAVCAVTALEGLQRISNLHSTISVR